MSETAGLIPEEKICGRCGYSTYDKVSICPHCGADRIDPISYYNPREAHNLRRKFIFNNHSKIRKEGN